MPSGNSARLIKVFVFCFLFLILLKLFLYFIKGFIFPFPTLKNVLHVCTVQKTPPAEQSGTLSLTGADKISKVVCSWTHAT